MSENIPQHSLLVASLTEGFYNLLTVNQKIIIQIALTYLQVNCSISKSSVWYLSIFLVSLFFGWFHRFYSQWAIREILDPRAFPTSQLVHGSITWTCDGNSALWCRKEGKCVCACVRVCMYHYNVCGCVTVCVYVQQCSKCYYNSMVIFRILNSERTWWCLHCKAGDRTSVKEK